MAIDTPEKRRSAIDFGKGFGCGTGMPVPFGSIPQASRQHICNIYSGVLVNMQAVYFWRNRNLPQATTWSSKVSLPDSGTQEL